MDGLTKVYVTVQSPGRHLVLNGDLGLLEQFLRAVERKAPDEGAKSMDREREQTQEVSEHAG